MLGLGIVPEGGSDASIVPQTRCRRFSEGREYKGSLNALERRRECYRLFCVLLVAVFSGGRFYHKNRLTSTFDLVYKEH